MPRVPACPGRRRSTDFGLVQGPVAKVISVIVIVITGVDIGLRRYQWRISPSHPDRVRPQHRLRGVKLFPLVLLLQRWSTRLMGRRRTHLRLLRPRPPLIDRADPVGRRAARGRHHQRHARSCHRPRPSALDRRRRDLATRASSQRFGRPNATRPSWTWYAVTCATRNIWSREAAHMMNLTEYRRKSQSFADFLPWAALVKKGVVLNKDGSFQRTAQFRGPDLDSATPAELVAITARLNNALRRLGSGWAIFIEAQRQSANRYPRDEFPDAISGLSMLSAVPSSKRKARISRAGISSLWFGCRRPKTRPAPKPGSMRGASTVVRIGARHWRHSSTAPTGCWH